ncbi:hypothetical protein Hypma_009278 [Hypsizygus marmoreus]|uniref:Aminoglycoside phosphotransferase domain-containing protein n=1 Tax=Hypsizygus marmoreus TaxID=39966 RepID=A0A369JQG4_HYPMA|nr:hypothetical protein Hypma_009278 [Hypsizygus marmoreus]
MTERCTVILPCCISKAMPPDQILQLREATASEFVVCHNDLSSLPAHNILVDETTLKVNVIIDWEYAGFFPPELDGAFCFLPRPSAASEGEVDDVLASSKALERWKT